MKVVDSYPLRKHIINTSIAIAISIIVTFIFGGFGSSWQNMVLNTAYGLLIGVTLAVGCGLLSTKMLSKGNWLENPVKRFVSIILVIMSYIIIDVIVINIFWFHFTQNRDFFEIFQHTFFVWIMATEFIIGMVIYLIILSSRFANKMNDFYIESQKDKEEIDKYKYATLKNQVNPHFLFNSLNVLSGMIYKDVDKADDFIGKLANIYRYVLDVHEDEVVDVNQEIAFTKDYLFLLSTRFGQNLIYEITAQSSKMIVPMALQILIENAVKHNIISSEFPLTISISNDEDSIIVSNGIHLKKDKIISHELGIKNLQNRYKYLTSREVIINKTKDVFEVRIPLLELKS